MIAAVVVGLCGLNISCGTSPAWGITEYAIPTAQSSPEGITIGPDGAIWFTEGHVNKIGRISPTGRITEYVIPMAASSPAGITSGPDGALWFTEYGANKIGRVTTRGEFTEFSIPTAGSSPAGITSGPDGALWFTETYGNKIGRMSTTGQFKEYSTPNPRTFPEAITKGPDGALWFVEPDPNNSIGRVTTQGRFTEYKIPTAKSIPNEITNGPDGAIWFTEAGKEIKEPARSEGSRRQANSPSSMSQMLIETSSESPRLRRRTVVLRERRQQGRSHDNKREYHRVCHSHCENQDHQRCDFRELAYIYHGWPCKYDLVYRKRGKQGRCPQADGRQLTIVFSGTIEP